MPDSISPDGASASSSIADSSEFQQALLSDGGDAHPASNLQSRLDRIERLLDPERTATAPASAAGRQVPAWRRMTAGESRWPVSATVAVAIGIQLALPQRLAMRPHWLLPALEIALLVGLNAANPGRIRHDSRRLRTVSLALAAVVSLANGWAAARLVWGLIHGTEGTGAVPLLITAGGIWATNVIVFALWYWEWDRGGPMSRAVGGEPFPDFLFAQMQSPDSAPPDWEPAFLDYLYLSFTNSTAFSPTDVMPMTRWAKMLMMVQSAVSLVTVVLVVARAVNILT
jgi:uncharacterized membrane protein